MLLEGKKALIFGLANNRSIAYGIARALKEHGASLAFSWLNDAILKRVEPLSAELGGDFIFPCDVSKDEDIAAAADTVRQKWGQVDVLVHAVAFAAREDLQGRFIDTSRAGFSLALDISAYSLVGLSRAFEPLMRPGSSIIAMTYYGADKVVPNYNVMGVAKAALQSSIRYLAYDLGEKGIRINGISAGPIKTLAASGISGFSSILRHFERHSPLKRSVTIEDVGNAAVYLASPLSGGQTGDTLYIDAGFNISGIQVEDKD